jgi:hypothetical protein
MDATLLAGRGRRTLRASGVRITLRSPPLLRVARKLQFVELGYRVALQDFPSARGM